MDIVKQLLLYDELQIYILPGFNSEIDTFKVDDLTITRLPYDFWIMIEKNQYIDDLEWDFLKKRPYFCILGSSKRTPHHEKANVHTLRSKKINRFVLALRLLNQSIMEYNPTEFISYEKVGDMIIRDTGLYGRKAYELEGSYSLSKQEVENSIKIYRSLSEYEEHYQLREISFAKSLFHQSFDIALNPLTKRTLLLLGTIEALANTENLKLLKRVKWRNEVLEDFLNNYRSLRNILAHGKEINDNTVLSCLIFVSRALLSESIMYIIENESSNPEEVLQVNLLNRLIENSRKGILYEKRFLAGFSKP